MNRIKMSTLKIASIIFITIVLAVSIYAGNVYYVDGVAGNDSNPGTQSLPWKTIQKAANTMVAGDKVIVKSGTYSERVSETTSGNSGNQIVYQVIAGGTVTCKGFKISGSYVTVDGFKVDADDNDYSAGRGFHVSGNYVTVKNCFATECPCGGIWYDENSSHGYIYNNRCYHNGQNGIEVWGSYHRVENNEIWESVQHHPQAPFIGGADADGVRFHGDHHTFIGNWIHEPALMSDPYNTDPHIDCFQTFDSSSHGAPAASYCTFERNRCRQYLQGMSTFMIEGSQLYPPHHISIKNNIFEVGGGINVNSGGGGKGHHIYVYNNTFIGGMSTVVGSAIVISNASDIEIINNITVDYKSNHRNIDGCTNVILNHNCAYNTNGSNPSGHPGPQSHELWAQDPKFVSLANRDFHLQSTSQCINSGATISVVTNDFDGVARPQGGLYDIGAYEYVGATTPLSANANATPTSGLAPLTVNFTGSASGGTTPYSYRWTFGDGGSSTAQSPSHTYSSVGTYTATLTVTDSKNATSSKSLTINVTTTSSQLVAISSADPTSGLTPLTVNFTGSGAGGAPPYSYNWNFGDGSSSSVQNPSHTYSAIGNYTVILTVTDSTSAKANATLSISVESATAANLALAAETGAPAPGQGGTTDPSPGNHSFSIGSTVSVKSISNTDYRFSKWSGDIAASNTFNSATTLTMDKNKSLSATFCSKCADVNGDLKITPADAQFAFDIYLGRIADPTWCELENADVNCSGTKLSPKITPSDAQTIFHKYLRKADASGDCSGSSRAAVLSMESSGFTNINLIIYNIAFAPGQDILIPIIIDSPSEIKAFGFDLVFPSDVLTYLGLERTELTKDFDQLDANVISFPETNQKGTNTEPKKTLFSGFDSIFASKILMPQALNYGEPSEALEQPAINMTDSRILRVGGYKTNPAVNPFSGVLVTLVFRVTGEIKDSSPISVIAVYDDLQNASIRNGIITPAHNTQIRKNQRSGQNVKNESPGKKYIF
jgi:PKD repeat protein